MKALATSFLAGPPEVEQIIARVARTLGRCWRWLRPLAHRYVVQFAEKARPTLSSVSAFLLQDPSFQRAWTKRASQLTVAQWLAEPAEMQPVAAAALWGVPTIASVGELSRWLRVSVSDLEWFADLKRIAARSAISPLRHYHYRVLAKSSGNVRLIEAPKNRLKAIERQILAEILERVPAHSAGHGFIKGRSIKTFAAEHVGKRVVLRMDLNDFFPTIRRARVQAIFRTAGYPEYVANLLGGICTTATPRRVWAGFALPPTRRLDENAISQARELYRQSHLPQGAPTSPALANLCAYRLDCRLTGLAQAAGACYTRYADDLAFSGEAAFERCVERFAIHVGAIALEEGWNVNHRKTRIMRQGVRQHLVGLVTNQRVNVVRADFDRLKATLTNCIRHGWRTQNREAHAAFRMQLEGRVSFVESINPAKGTRLRDLFNRIEW